jgi:hypothetical protein
VVLEAETGVLVKVQEIVKRALEEVSIVEEQ